MTVDVASPGRLSADEIAEVLSLVAAADAADGVNPLSEQVLLHLRHGGDPAARNLLARERGILVGYAHLDTDPIAGSSAELAVHPDHRRAGIGAALLEALERAGPDGRLGLWAHGRLAGAGALARSHGYVEERVLWRMRRSLDTPIDEVRLPAGVRLRAFVPGQDEQAWLEVNNRAFADHPDQGRWTLDDVYEREQEPWFDPAGFLLAESESDGALLGFHWTKVHGGGQHEEPIGEVYVLGIDPAAQGRGLGPTLTLAGLRYLQAKGLTQVMLYVDESNSAAMRVYERLGFTRWDVDVQFRRGDRPKPGPVG
ncbi:MAG TPA: mycothiol synthase [Mycobacteriales bacterium]